jgi:DNA-binding transcriptional MerR regulator
MKELKQAESELEKAKQEKMSIDEIRSILYQMNTKSNEILSHTLKLTNAFSKIKNFTDEQYAMLKNIFEGIAKENSDSKAQSRINSILTDIKTRSSKDLNGKILEFLGYAGSIASLYPYITQFTSALFNMFIK